MYQALHMCAEERVYGNRELTDKSRQYLPIFLENSFVTIIIKQNFLNYLSMYFWAMETNKLLINVP